MLVSKHGHAEVIFEKCPATIRKRAPRPAARSDSCASAKRFAMRWPIFWRKAVRMMRTSKATSSPCRRYGCRLTWKLATIYVMPLGGRDTAVVIAALERNKKFLRGEVARRVNLKFAPDIRFRVDERSDEAERIEKLLRTPAVQRDLEQDPDSDREEEQ